MLFKLHDTVDTDGLVRYFVDENVGRVHVFESNAVGSVVHAFAIPIVAGNPSRRPTHQFLSW